MKDETFFNINPRYAEFSVIRHPYQRHPSQKDNFAHVSFQAQIDMEMNRIQCSCASAWLLPCLH